MRNDLLIIGLVLKERTGSAAPCGLGVGVKSETGRERGGIPGRGAGQGGFAGQGRGGLEGGGVVRRADWSYPGLHPGQGAAALLCRHVNRIYISQSFSPLQIQFSKVIFKRLFK